MELYEIIEKYGKGKGEPVMWEAVRLVSDFARQMRDTDAKWYWSLMRQVHGMLTGGHYSEEFAEHDVSRMEWKDREGKMRSGAYWTLEQVRDAVRGRELPKGATIYDAYVAYNATATDLCAALSDKELADVAFLTWFDDVDWSDTGSSTKIWDYMLCKYGV